MFRLRVSNSKNNEIHTIGPFKPSKPINQIHHLFRRNNSSKTSSRQFRDTLNSKNSIILLNSTTPSDIVLQNNLNRLPFVTLRDKLNQRSHTTLSSAKSSKKSLLTNRTQLNLDQNQINGKQTYDCTCILCLNKILMNSTNRKSKSSLSFKSDENLSVNSKNLIDTLNQLKTTIKVNRELITINDINETNNKTKIKKDSDSDSDGERIRLLSRTSRIKLWKPNEINEWAFTNFKKDSPDLKMFSDENYSTETGSTSFTKDDMSYDDSKFPLNPPSSPLPFHHRIPVALAIDDY